MMKLNAKYQFNWFVYGTLRFSLFWAQCEWDTLKLVADYFDFRYKD